MPYYSFDPDPSTNDLAESIRCGWSYAGDLVDPINPNASLTEKAIRQAVSIAKKLLEEDVAIHYPGLGVVCGISQDKDGNPMFLRTFNQGVKLLPVSNLG